MTGTRLYEGERIYRYEVPVDDQWHEFQLWGDPLAVGCRVLRAVEFWARYSEGEGSPLTAKRAFIVVGTGHPIPADVRYWSTVILPGGGLVWHLLERRPS